MTDDQYWDREIETMAPEALGQLQDQRVRAQIAWVYEHSPFYRERMDECNLTPADIQSVQDLAKLPLMEKADYRREQEAYPPYGRLLCVPEEQLVRYWTTSGSTGKPTNFATNLDDYLDYLESAARVLWTAGVRPGWKMAVPFSHGHWIGLWGVFDASWLKVGAQIVPMGGYDTQYRVRKMAELQLDAFCATPTYAAYMSEIARGMGIDVRSIGVKTILTAGEPASDATRRAIEDTWGAETYDFYGNTENLSYLGVDCREKKGFHFWEDRVVVEVVDEAGNPVPDGEEGELVFTNLSSRSMPAIRLRIGDITRLDRSPCGCGRTHVRVLYILGRREHVLKIRGLNIYPRVVEDIVRSFANLGSEYRLVFRRDRGLDVLAIQVEPLPGADHDTVRGQLSQRVRETCGVNPTVEILAHGTLPRSEVKAKRVFDERDATNTGE